MRYPSEHKQQTRERNREGRGSPVLQPCSERAGIGDLMRDLHLTTAGFTGTSSARKSCRRGFRASLKQLAHQRTLLSKRAPKGGELKALHRRLLGP